MANQRTIITFGQMGHYSMETTSIRLKKNLRENHYSAFALQHFVAHVCALKIIYENFCINKVVDTSLYHQDLFAAYRQEDWSLTMMRYVGRLKEHMTPNEWAFVSKIYYRKKRREMMQANELTVHQQLALFDQAAAQVMGKDFVKETIAINN